MLYLHGGAYTMGNADAYRGFVSQIAARAQCKAFILDYPLAPEASIPVALELARAAVDSLLAIYPRIAIVGDSAGGGSPSQRSRICATGGASPLPCCSHPGRI